MSSYLSWTMGKIGSYMPFSGLQCLPESDEFPKSEQNETDAKTANQAQQVLLDQAPYIEEGPSESDLSQMEIVELKPNQNAEYIQEKMEKSFALANQNLDGISKNLSAQAPSVDQMTAHYTQYSQSAQMPRYVTHVETPALKNFEVAIGFMQGDRKSMEDSHLATTIQVKGQEIAVFGIFDGHGGSQTAKLVSQKLAVYLQKELSSFQELDDVAVWNALKNAFVKLNDYVTKQTTDGATATVALVFNNTVYTANTGDSRTILSQNDLSVQLSEDSSPTMDRYRKGIEKRNGFVTWGRVNGYLAVARAFGDKGVAGITVRPKITKHEFTPGDNNFLVLGCDGVFDVLSTHGVIRYGQNKTCKDLAGAIPGIALHAGSGDNISTMVVKYKSMP